MNGTYDSRWDRDRWNQSQYGPVVKKKNEPYAVSPAPNSALDARAIAGQINPLLGNYLNADRRGALDQKLGMPEGTEAGSAILTGEGERIPPRTVLQGQGNTNANVAPLQPRVTMGAFREKLSGLEENAGPADSGKTAPNVSAGGNGYKGAGRNRHYGATAASAGGSGFTQNRVGMDTDPKSGKRCRRTIKRKSMPPKRKRSLGPFRGV